MNRCKACGTGVPKEAELCGKCRAAGVEIQADGWAMVPSVAFQCKLDELLVKGKPEPFVKDGKQYAPVYLDGEHAGWVGPIDAGAAAAPTQDKSLIWEDCPACAMKHLAAAYAAVTSPDCGIVCATRTEVLAARSLIAIRECESGYSGNAALAAGCLALAETAEGGTPENRKAWRDARLMLLEGDLRGAEEYLLPPSLAALAAGHIAEALRELPELADRTCVGSLFSDGNFEPDTAGGLRDWLRESIGWITKTHELGVRE